MARAGRSEGDEEVLREARHQDAPLIARLHRAVVRECLPFLPELHTAEEDQRFFADHFLSDHEVWVWDEGGICGYCGFRPDWLSHLYVDPSAHGRGIGSSLLNKAKLSNDTLNLWVFQKNRAAIAFYERHGFCLAEQTDGERNDEKEPDARYVWRRMAK